jgi:hypothetical protein
VDDSSSSSSSSSLLLLLLSPLVRITHPARARIQQHIPIEEMFG